MKSIARKLLNKTLKPILAELSGSVLDVASGKSPSYHKLIPDAVQIVGCDTITKNIKKCDFNQRFPFDDAEFDHCLCINAIYIAKDPVFTLSEMARVTKRGGRLVIVTPFIFPEAREPHDFRRWTSEGLEQLCRQSNLVIEKTVSFGGHFTSSLLIIEPFLLFSPVKWVAGKIAVGLDRLVPKKYSISRPCPLGYILIAKAVL